MHKLMQKEIATIGGMPQYTRGQVLEALVKLVGLDSVIMDLSIIAYNEGYDRTEELLEQARSVARDESYRLKGE